MSTLPLDPYQRRADWLAALVVAMVVVPGFATALEAAAARAAAAPAARPAHARAPRRAMARAGHVRPPRSC